jgi:hypothetical protein
MLYAVKIGPVPTREGPATFYCGFEDNIVHPPIMADSDLAALRQLAAKASSDDLQCDQALSKAAKKAGFTVSEAPEWVRAQAVAMVISLACRSVSGIGSPLLLYGLATAAARFKVAAPWTRWDDNQALEVSFSGGFRGRYEAAILGRGGTAIGLAIYPEKGAAAKAAKLVASGKGAKARKLDSLALIFDDEISFATDLLHRLIGIASVPLAMKLKNGEMKDITDGEILALASTLNGAAALHIRAREIVGDSGVEGYSKGIVRARIVAPKPSHP